MSSDIAAQSLKPQQQSLPSHRATVAVAATVYCFPILSKEYNFPGQTRQVD
ncbi:hypothetical protein PTTG_27351 [Puccinia triticina 1-1 BBBD Race 1]|uniref:Uncharacterized protein n=1 Tax=Puccinia triticina (isolate 1-1 / race 1 (BBBD)) TaxID=630390 RepID=A0A180GM71_PUCT1|nr:hypothetical protein PTTG_27351 [Puccinia triticina 1-1 BBBD Race 1]